MVLCLSLGCSASLFSDGSGSGEQVIKIVPCETIEESDAVCNFTGEQGGLTDQWTYVDDHRDRTWTEMPSSEKPGTISGEGTRITTCLGEVALDGCQEDTAELLIEIDAGTDDTDAAIEFTPPSEGEYQISGSFRIVGSDSVQLLIYRNTREDVLFSDVALEDLSTGFDFNASLLATDRVYLAVGTQDTSNVVLGLQYSVKHQPNSDSACSLSLNFETIDAAEISTSCAGLTYTAYRDVGVTTGDYEDLENPDLIPSVIPELGNAMEFKLGDYLEPPSGGISYPGSFTVQFWLSFPSGTFDYDSSYFPVILSEYEFSGTTEGVFMAVSETGNLLADYTVDGVEQTSDYPLPDFEWHFVRLVRASSDVDDDVDDDVDGDVDGDVDDDVDDDAGSYLCIDGRKVSEKDVLDGAFTSGIYPYIGRTTRSGFSGFEGALDDIRIVQRALPCRGAVE